MTSVVGISADAVARTLVATASPRFVARRPLPHSGARFVGTMPLGRLAARRTPPFGRLLGPASMPGSSPICQRSRRTNPRRSSRRPIDSSSAPPRRRRCRLRIWKLGVGGLAALAVRPRRTRPRIDGGTRRPVSAGVLGQRRPVELRVDEHGRLGRRAARARARARASGGRVASPAGVRRRPRGPRRAHLGAGRQLDVRARRSRPRAAGDAHERRAAAARSRRAGPPHRSGLVRLHVHQVGRPHRVVPDDCARDLADAGVRGAYASAVRLARDGRSLRQALVAREFEPAVIDTAAMPVRVEKWSDRRPSLLSGGGHHLGRIEADQRAVDSVQVRESRGSASKTVRCPHRR